MRSCSTLQCRLFLLYLTWALYVHRVDAEFSAKARIQMLTDGTTATVAIIHDSKIYVGNGMHVTSHPL